MTRSFGRYQSEPSQEQVSHHAQGTYTQQQTQTSRPDKSGNQAQRMDRVSALSVRSAVPQRQPAQVDQSQQIQHVSFPQLLPSQVLPQPKQGIPPGWKENSDDDGWEQTILERTAQRLARRREYRARGMDETSARQFVLMQLEDDIRAQRQGVPSDVITERFTLTAQQTVMVRMLCQGFSSTRIAAELGLSRSTIETHLRNARIRIGVASREELVAFLRTTGYV